MADELTDVTAKEAETPSVEAASTPTTPQPTSNRSLLIIGGVVILLVIVGLIAAIILQPAWRSYVLGSFSQSVADPLKNSDRSIDITALYNSDSQPTPTPSSTPTSTPLATTPTPTPTSGTQSTPTPTATPASQPGPTITEQQYWAPRNSLGKTATALETCYTEELTYSPCLTMSYLVSEGYLSETQSGVSFVKLSGGQNGIAYTTLSALDTTACQEGAGATKYLTYRTETGSTVVYCGSHPPTS